MRIKRTWTAALFALLGTMGTNAWATVDSYGLGDGHNGDITVSTASRVVNAYAPVTAGTSTTLTIGAVRGTGTFAPGDLVLVWQTAGFAGAVSGTQTTVNLQGSNATGHYEFQRVLSVAGNVLTFEGAFTTNFSLAAGATQVILVPEYQNVTILAAQGITGLPWDGASGGIVAFLSTKGVVNGGSINATGLGFLQGVAGPNEGSSNCAGFDGPLAAFASGQYGRKGGGIASGALTGYGNMANGAGGGNCHNSGGGGGGGVGGSLSVATQGRGGNAGGRWADDGDTGGRGGAGIVVSTKELSLGGGGGSGHVNQSTGTNGSGANGGGAIFIRALSFTGNGTVSAAGNAAVNNPEQCDPAGGGGGGGLIHIRSSSDVACGAASTVVGGRGGSHDGSCGTYTTLAMGVGGGGGGGLSLIQGSSTACTPIVLGGAVGTSSGNVSNKAQAGGVGANVTVNTPYFVPTVSAPSNSSVTPNLRPTLSATGEPGATMFIFVDGNQVCTGKADNAGVFSCAPASDLSYGAHSVTARESGSADLDDAGPASTANSFTVACANDGECSSTQYCQASNSTCVAKIANGSNVPSGDPTHNPALDGTCSTAVGSAVCVSGVCDTTDNKCGFTNGMGSCNSGNAATVCRSGVCGGDGVCGIPNGEGSCNSGNAATVCRSGICSTTGNCMAANSCLADADCSSGWCDINAKTCTAKLANGSSMPTDVGHVTPVLNGACNTDAATLVCVVGRCDSADNKCGLASGTNCVSPTDNAACRAGVCDATDSKCGLVNGTNCGGATECRSGICASGKCSTCSTDADCGSSTSGKVCDPTAGGCKDGCRGSGGNGCVVGQVCSSTTTAIGTCSTPIPDAGVDAAKDGSVSDASSDAAADASKDASASDTGTSDSATSDAAKDSSVSVDSGIVTTTDDSLEGGGLACSAGTLGTSAGTVSIGAFAAMVSLLSRRRKRK